MLVRPYYEANGITIYHGDCREMATPAADRLITDPPYGFKKYEADREVAPAFLWGLVCAYKSAAVFGYPENLVRWLLAANATAPVEWVTWWPTNKVAGRGNLLPRETEHIAVFGEVVGARRLTRPRNASGIGQRISASRGLDTAEARLGDVWRDPAPGMAFNYKKRLHPNEKPVRTMERLVEMLSHPGETVFDPFMGSGTTLLAAARLGRQAIGMDVTEAHCEVAARRITEMQPSLEVA